MKTFTRILVSSFLFLSGINFVHAQFCSVFVSGSATICSGNCITLNAMFQSSPPCSSVSYSWSPSSALSNPNISNPVACPSQTTTYTVVACCLSSGCCDTATVTINVIPVPMINISGPVSICAGQNATLCASGGIVYYWSNGATIACITVSPTVTTVYCVTGTDANGCTDSSCVAVTVYTCMGVAENNLSNQINIYPNPFAESTIIRIDDAQLIPSEFKMYDLFGKEIKCLRIQNPETKITRDKLPAGLYYYKLLQNGKIIDKGKILLNN